MRERPIKPNKPETQSSKEFRNSETIKKYKNDLKKWKECVSPLAISQRDEERINQEQKKREEKEKAEKLEALNNCGEKPSKPKRPKGLSIDDFRKTEEHGEYRKQLKEWKRCMSPQQLTEPVFSKKKLIKLITAEKNPLSHTELKEQTTKIIEILRPTKIIVNFSKSGKIVKTILKRPSYGVIAGQTPKTIQG